MSREGPYTLTVLERRCGGCRYHGSALLLGPGPALSVHRCWHPRVTEPSHLPLPGPHAEGRYIGSTDRTPSWCPCASDTPTGG